MRLGSVKATAIAAVALTVAAAGTAAAHDGSRHKAQQGGAEAPAVKTDTAKIKLLDLELVDKTGRPLRFKSEAVGERIVAIDFIYTTCTTVCPVLSSVFSIVQDQLGDKLGREVRLISISIDPVRDTPRRMTAYAKKFGAGDDWIWLTGKKPTVDRLLVKLGAYTPEVEDHPPMFVIGDAKTGTWRRLFGFPAPEDIVAELDDLIAARRPEKTTLKAEK